MRTTQETKAAVMFTNLKTGLTFANTKERTQTDQD